MRKYKEVKDGIIVSVGESLINGTTISDEEYNAILSVINNKPIADYGYGYRLRTDLTWELVELPPVPNEPTTYTEDELAAMTNAELEQILYRYRRTANMNKANMVELIIHLQSESNSL